MKAKNKNKISEKSAKDKEENKNRIKDEINKLHKQINDISKKRKK